MGEWGNRWNRNNERETAVAKIESQLKRQDRLLRAMAEGNKLEGLH